MVASFALTEPEAGSDPSDLTTAARRDGDDWIINGTKRYITNAPVADLFLVFARSDPEATGSRGISAFLVPADTPGLTVGPKDHKMGQAGAWTADVYLDDVRVADDQVVGGDRGVGRGYATAMGCLAHGRVHIAALCVGMAERLVDESVAYAKERKQGGQPIASFQLVQGLIADSQTDYLAGRSLVLASGRSVRPGRGHQARPVVRQVLRQRDGRPGGRPGRAGPRRRRLHAWRGRRALLPRRPALPDLRGHQPDPAGDHRPPAPGRRGPVAQWLTQTAKGRSPLLDGVRVVDLTSTLSGPYGTLLLGDLGAEVVKVEPPAGDPVRDIGPRHSPDMGAIFLNLNRNKRSVVLDLDQRCRTSRAPAVV